MLAREIGLRIREARRAQNLRQDELAIASGVSTKTIHNIEHGYSGTGLDTIIQVLSVLGLDLDLITRRPSLPADSAEVAPGGDIDS